MQRMSLASAAVLLLMCGVPASAQIIGRGPNINVGNIVPRVDPHLHISPNVNTVDRTGDGSAGESAPARKPRPKPAIKTAAKSPQSNAEPGVAGQDYVANEVLIELDGTPPQSEVEALAQRHRLTRVQSQAMPIAGSTFYRWRIADSRSVDDVVRQLGSDGKVKSAQRNIIYRTQQSGGELREGDAAQYALAKLRLPQAHALSKGEDVVVAVIDSGIDAAHPEISGSIKNSFDALGSSEGPHPHGTAIAGIIAAHGKLAGSAPAAKLLAIRAFGAQKTGAESTSFVVLKSLDFAVANGARVINMSFAGARDKAVGRALAVATDKGAVLIAAAGNGGPKSRPLFPGADGNVVAVTATDSADRIFTGANRGSYVALAAPGVDILSSAPDGNYQVVSGTSVAAAYVSGMAALMIARDRSMTPADARAALLASARDAGPKGRDDQFGAGIADAYGALTQTAAPVAAAGRPVR